MKTYHIADLEQLSGIKAHTIRIWEKRYGLIKPTRTSTNIRLYDDEQLKKILNTSTLLTKGFKISKIAKMKEVEINKELDDLKQFSSPDVICVALINDLIAAMVSFNEVAFEITYSAAVTRFGMFEAMIKVFYPFLYKVGFMWIVSDVTPVQEHFASCIIRRKLMAAIDGLPSSNKKTKKFLLLLPPDEWHEIGLLFSHYIIKAKGYEVFYLGQNVPYENLGDIMKAVNPNFVLAFFVSRKSDEELEGITRKNLKVPTKTRLLASGNIDMMKIIKNEPNTLILNSPYDLLKLL